MVPSSEEQGEILLILTENKIFLLLSFNCELVQVPGGILPIQSCLSAASGPLLIFFQYSPNNAPPMPSTSFGNKIPKVLLLYEPQHTPLIQ
jgi:hypothetical protein